MRSFVGLLAVAAIVMVFSAEARAAGAESAAGDRHAPAVERGHNMAHESSDAEGGGQGEHAGFRPGTFALQLLNFGALLFLLIYFGGRAMNRSLRTRHEQLKNEIGEATRLRDEAKAKFDAQERRVAELEKEVAALRETMRQEAEREQARAIEAAQERAKQLQEDMRMQIDQQVRQAEAVLRAEVSNAALALAEEIARNAVDMEDQRRLAQEFVVGSGGETH